MTNEEFVRHVSQAERNIYRVARSILKNDEDCADAAQSAILHAFDKLDTLKQEKFFSTWFTRILINECYRILKDRKKQVAYEEYMVEKESETCHSEVFDAVMELENIYRIPFVLHYVEGYSVKEIATILHISVSNVKIRLSRARNRLRNILEGE